ncbi:MAG: hypothetical protein RJA44_1012, partial [Pseudomonadota bacterium]
MPMTRRRALDALGACGLTLLARPAGAAAVAATPGCAQPLYLTFDTGHMGVAPLVAEVLGRLQLKASFFLANEKTLDGGSSLDERWAPWWRERAREGHLFGSHTFDHVYWRGDLPGGRFRLRPTFGPQAERTLEWDGPSYCIELQRSATRFEQMSGQRMAPLFRAPGGKTSPALLAAARQGGWHHVPWSPAGFLGDELPSEQHPNERLLRQALASIRPGDILLA